MIYIREKYKHLFTDLNSISDYFSISGKVFKEFKNRKTILFELNDRKFFIKCHWGVGWIEIIKNLINLKLPVLGAITEWKAINRISQLGVSTLTPVAYGVEGINPAAQRSFLITEDLGKNISLEKLSDDWIRNPPNVKLKRKLILKLADIARRLHENGVNHRDFYICHFLLALSNGESSLQINNLNVYLIDLHRVQIRKSTPERWITKDIGSLLFSSMDIGLTKRDLLRFIKAYREKPLRNILSDEKDFWIKVQHRATKLYRSHWNKEPSFQIN